MDNLNNTAHILIIEDDDDHAALIARVLKDLEPTYFITRIKDGAEAIQFFEKSPPFESRQLPHLVLLDLKMPKKGGHEVLERIKSDPQFRMIPIVILTTSDAEADKKMAYTHYVNSYLVKPMEAGQFKIILNDLNKYWNHLNKSAFTGENLNE